MLPLTPALQLARTKDFCQEEWEDILEDLLDSGFGGNMVNNQWKSIVLTGSQSMLEDDTMRHDAYQSLRSLPTNEFDDGLTKVWALYWTASQKSKDDQRTLTSMYQRPMNWKKQNYSISKHSTSLSIHHQLITSCDIFKNSRYEFSGHQTFAYPHDGVTSLELCEAKCLDLGGSICKYFNYREGVSCHMGAVSTASYDDDSVVSGRCGKVNPISTCYSTSAPTYSISSNPTITLTITPTKSHSSIPIIPSSLPTVSPTFTVAPTANQNDSSVPTISPTFIDTVIPTLKQDGFCDSIKSHHFSLSTSCISYGYNVQSFNDCKALCQNESDNCKYFNYLSVSKSCSMGCELKDQSSGPYGAFPNSGEQDAGVCAITATWAPTYAVTMTLSPAFNPEHVPTANPTSIVTNTPTSNRNQSCKQIQKHHFNLDLGTLYYRYSVQNLDECEVLCQNAIGSCKYFNYVLASKTCSFGYELKERYPSGPYGAFPNNGEQDAGICSLHDE